MRRNPFGLLLLGQLGLLVVACACSSGSPTGPPPPLTPPLASHTPAVDLTGSYRFTVMASPSCATVVDKTSGQPFPDVAHMRSFDAVVSQSPAGAVKISLSDRGHQLITFDGGIDRKHLTFQQFLGPVVCDDYWAEEIQPGEYFTACGNWSAFVEDATAISGSLDGDIEYWRFGDVVQTAGWVCGRTDHRFALTKP